MKYLSSVQIYCKILSHGKGKKNNLQKHRCTLTSLGNNTNSSWNCRMFFFYREIDNQITNSSSYFLPFLLGSDVRFFSFSLSRGGKCYLISRSIRLELEMVSMPHKEKVCQWRRFWQIPILWVNILLKIIHLVELQSTIEESFPLLESE